MKNLLFATLLTAALAFAQPTGGSTDGKISKNRKDPRARTAQNKKGAKSKKSSGGTTTPPPK